MASTCLDNEFDFPGSITMFIPWGDTSGMVPQRATGSLKAAQVLRIHLFKQTFIHRGKGNAGRNPVPQQGLFGLANNRMGQLFQPPTLHGGHRRFTHDGGKDLGKGFGADMAMASKLRDRQRPGEMLLKKTGRFSQDVSS